MAGKRLLVLTSATGGGHDVHARATVEWCGKLFGNTVGVKVDHALENSHSVHRIGLQTYHYIQTKIPLIQHLYFHLIELQELFNRGGIRFGQEYYEKLLSDFRPDAILSVHDCLNLGYLEIAKSVLGDTVSFGTYCTEFSGGYGFSRNWINRGVDFFFGRTSEVAEEAARRGVDPAKIHVAGHWAPLSFYEPRLSTLERESGLEELGLEPKRFTVLLSTGGAGYQNHQRFLDALLPLHHELQVIALCRNPLVERELSAWHARHPSFLLRGIPFTDKMSRFLQLANVVVSRPGSATCGEALLSGCPVILDTLGGIMPQEMLTWRYLKNHNLAQRISREGELTRTLRKWMDHPEWYLRFKVNTASRPSDPTPEAFLKLLLGIN